MPRYRSPYHWSRRNGDWRIGAGPSSFLVCKGSGWSAPFGYALFRQLCNRARPDKPKKGKYRRRRRGLLDTPSP